MSYRGCGDWLFWIYITEKGDVCYVAEPLNLFRQHQNNTTSSLDLSGNNPIEVHQIYNYLVDNGYLKGWNKKWFRASRLPYYCWGKISKNPEVKAKILEVWRFTLVDYILALIYSVVYEFKKTVGRIEEKIRLDCHCCRHHLDCH